MKRAIGIIAIGLAVLVVVGGGWLVWGSWISPMERRAMRIALDRIDDVAKYEGNDNAVYDKRLQEAQSAILLCRKRQITAYDHQLVPLVDMQLKGAQAEHTARLRAETDRRYSQTLKVVGDVNRESETLLREHLQ